ncbi:hypothetical protein RI129_008800 [Pyrocoelia pectoralis]|uniref:Uncharacterized protein n=1 Tax=Pyrocoelia pectoralis TaxID=417401 RepID=A0AAN7VC26_9COLE
MTMEDCVIEAGDVISSDDRLSNSDEELRNWDRKITQKILLENSTSKIEEILEYVLTEYTRILKKNESDVKMKMLVKDIMLDHVKIFHISFPTCSIRTSKVSNYLEIMQSVLVIVCNLELDIARQIKIADATEYNKKIIEITERLIYILSIYLLSDNLSICHVLLKLHPRFDSRQWKDVMRVVYRHFLVMEPVCDKSIENFCRNYLLFQNLKAIINKKNHARTDSLLYSRFSMSPDSLKKNHKIRRILRPLSNSIIDLVDMLTDHKQSPVNNYFKYIENKKKEEDTPLSIYVDSDSEEDDIEILPNVVNFSNQDSSSSRVQGNDVVILVDDDDIKVEDEYRSPINNRVICLDDDSDCEVTMPSDKRSIPKKRLNLEPSYVGISFLDLISSPKETIPTLESPPYSVETESSPDDHLQITTETNDYENDLDMQGIEVTDLFKGSDNQMENEAVEKNESEVEGVVLPNDTELEKEAVQTCASESRATNEISATFPNTDEEVCLNPIQNESFLQQTSIDSILPTLHTENELNIECADTIGVDSDLDHCTKKDTQTIEKPESPPNGSFNLMHGLITPPKSDRISDDVTGNGSKNVYVPNIMSIESICYNGFQNIPLTTETSSYEHTPDLNREDEHNTHKTNEENTTYENYESPENLDLNSDHNLILRDSDQNLILHDSDQNLILHESIDIADCDVNHYTSTTDESPILNTSSTLELNDEINTEDDISSISVVPIENYHLPLSDMISSKQDSPDSTIKSTTCSSIRDESPMLNASSSLELNDEINTEDDISSISVIPMEDYHLPLSDMISSKQHSPDSTIKSTICSSITEKKSPNLSSESANYSDIIDDTRTCNINKSSSSSNNSENFVPSETKSVHRIKANGNLLKTSESKSISDKVIFTSSEKLSAPLSLFSKFEQLQSELVEKACSGPIEPMSMYVNSVDHSNSNDSLNTFSYSSPPHPPITEDSPISPPYEQIHAQDYQNHCDHLINNFSSTDNGVTTQIEARKLGQTVPVPIDRKRKLDDGRIKDTKIQLATKKVRFDGLPLIENEVLYEAKESMDEYRIRRDDAKLVYLQPQVPIRIESASELKEKEEQLRFRGLLHSTERSSGNTCIVKRVDYKHISGAVISPSGIRHTVSNLIHKNMDTSRVENIPSGYVPPLNGYSSGFRYNYETRPSNNSTFHRNYASGIQRSLNGDTSASYQIGPKRSRGRPRRAFNSHPKGPT